MEEQKGLKNCSTSKYTMHKCECGFSCLSKFNLQRHQKSKSHELNMLCGETVVSDENGEFQCKRCNYSTSRKGNFRKHVLSTKHVAARNNPVPVSENAQLEIKPVMLMEFMAMILKHQENQHVDMAKLAQQISSVATHGDNNTTVSNSTITNKTTNKKFNLNIFLNEECKNALNLSDFIQNLEVKMEDIEHMCEVGYTKGMSKIMTKAMNRTPKTERPMHCSDSKRETIYVRNDDTWKKDENKEECEKLINHIISKNYKLIAKWCEENPDHKVFESPAHEKWYNMTREMCNTDPKAMKKLIRHLAITTEIDKDDEE